MNPKRLTMGRGAGVAFQGCELSDGHGRGFVRVLNRKGNEGSCANDTAILGIICMQYVYSRETSRPNRRALIQSTATRTRLRAVINVRDMIRKVVRMELNWTLTAEAHAQVGTAPEEVGQGTTTGDVAREPGDIGNGTLLTNVGQATLVGVLEGTNLLGSTELLLALTDLIKNLIALIVGLGLGLGVGQVLKFLFNGISLGHGVEETSQEGTLLTGNLSSGSIVGNSTIANGPDVLGTVHDKVFVDSKTTAGVLLSGDLTHQITDNRANGVTSGPNQQTVGDSLDNLGSIRISDLGLNVLVGDILDHSLSADGDLFLLEGRFGVVNQLFGEHGQNVGQSFDQSNVEVVLNLGDPLLQIIVEEILKLTSELDTSGATTDDDHVQQALDLIGSLILEHSSFDTIHDTLTDVLSIVDLLQEARVLANTRDTYEVPVSLGLKVISKGLNGER